MITTLVDDLHTYLVGLPPERWGTLKPGDLFPFVKAQDPDEILHCKTRKIFLVPLKPEYNFDEKIGRGQVRSIGKEYTINTVVVYPATTIQKNDVATWQEVKDIWELRELLTNNILQFVTEYNLVRIETEDPLETQLDQRNFVLMVDFVYSTRQCGIR